MIQFSHFSLLLSSLICNIIDFCKNTLQEESSQCPMTSLCFVADSSIKMNGAERIQTKVPSPQRLLQGVCYLGEPLTKMTALDSYWLTHFLPLLYNRFKDCDETH